MTFQKLGAKILHVKHISHCCVLLLKNSIWHFSSSRISVIHAQQELGRTENWVLWSLWRSLKRNQFTSTSHLGEGLAENSHTNPPLLGAVFRKVIAVLKFQGDCCFDYFFYHSVHNLWINKLYHDLKQYSNYCDFCFQSVFCLFSVCFQSTSSPLPVCFQSTSSPLPVRFQSASSLLPVHFKSASSPLPVLFQSTSSLLPAYWNQISAKVM